MHIKYNTSMFLMQQSLLVLEEGQTCQASTFDIQFTIFEVLYVH